MYVPRRLIVVCLFVLLANPSYSQFGPSIPSAPSPPGGGGRSFNRPSSRPNYSRPSTPSFRRPTTPQPNFRRPTTPTPPSNRWSRPNTRPGANPYSPGGNRGIGSSPSFGSRQVGPVFRNPLAQPSSTPRTFNPSTAARNIRIPTPTIPGIQPSARYTSSNPAELQKQITQNLQTDKSLQGLMTAVDAIDRRGITAPYAATYRNQALQMAQQQIRAGGTDPLPWIATAKLSAQSGNDALFRNTASQFVEKFPTNPHAHLFQGMQALKDEDWRSAEAALKRAKALGIPEESIAGMLKMAIDNQKWIWEYAQVIGLIILVWLIGLLTIYLLGLLLSRVTLQAIEQDQLDANSKSTRLIRRIYRVVVGAAGIYYYISLPIILLSAIALPLAIGYAVLSTPYLNLILLAVILIGGLGGIITAISGIRTAVLRVPDTPQGCQLRPGEAKEFWSLTSEVADAMKTRTVDQIWITPSTEMAVTERGSWWARFRDRGNRVLIMGVALLDGFQADSLRAVLAHEFAHFRHRDTAGGDVALRVQYSMHRFADAINERGKIRWWDITIHFLRIFHYMFTRLTLGASRLQEVLADRAAVELYGTDPFIDGFMHVIRRSVEFDRVITVAIDQQIRSSTLPANFFSPSPALPADDLAGVEATLQQIYAQPTTVHDSHPSPKQRIAMACQWNVADVGDDSLAEQLFDDSASQIREEMSTMLSDFVKRRSNEIQGLNGVLIEAISDMLSERGNDPGLRMERARMYFELNQHAKAIEDVDQVINHVGDRPDLRWYRAMINDDRGGMEKSVIQDLQHILKRARSATDELLFDVNMLIAKQFKLIGQETPAFDAYGRALRLDPDSYLAATERLTLAEKLGRGAEEEFVKLRESISKRWPDLQSPRTAAPPVTKPHSLGAARFNRTVWQTLAAIGLILIPLFGAGTYFAGRTVVAALERDSFELPETAPSAPAADSKVEVKKPAVDVSASASSSTPPTAAAVTRPAVQEHEVAAFDPQSLKRGGENRQEPVKNFARDLAPLLTALGNPQTHERENQKTNAERSLLSWRVRVLPYVGQQDLYDQFKHDEEWDSPHNVKLISKMPEFYQYEGDEPGLTRLRSLYRGGKQNQLPNLCSTGGFPDGDAETIQLVFTGRDTAVCWTQPDPQQIGEVVELAEALSLRFAKPTFLVMGDGQLYPCKLGIDLKRLHALATPDGGEHVSAASWLGGNQMLVPPPEGYQIGPRPKGGWPKYLRGERARMNMRKIAVALVDLEIPKDSQLSWRVHLLPALGMRKLYSEFKLDEPWDSPHNYRLIARMPAVFDVGLPKGWTGLRGVESIVSTRVAGSQVHLASMSKLAVILADPNDCQTWTRPELMPVSADDAIWKRKVWGATIDGRLISIDSGVDKDLLDPGTSLEPEPVQVGPAGKVAGAIEFPKAPEPVPCGGSNTDSWAMDGAQNELAKIGVALIKHSSTHKYYPRVRSSSHQDDVKLSWRVALLPFLGEQELYDKFDHDQPWDSEANRPLLDQMPDIYRSSPDEKGTTRIRMFVGRGMVFEGDRDQGINYNWVRDRPEATVIGGRVGPDKAVPWTQPIDLETTPAKLLEAMGDVGPVAELIPVQRGFLRASTSLPAEVFAALATRDGGELIDGGSIDRRTAHLQGKPLYSDDQALYQHAYHLSAIVRCMHHEFDAGRALPPRSGRGGLTRRHLSWRVHILKRLGYFQLYEQFRFDEPWDSPHNRQLIPYMPDIYRDGDAPADSTTTRYLTVAGRSTTYPDSGPGIRPDRIRDGASKSILLIQTPPGREVIWTKPENVAFDPTEPLAGMGKIPPAQGLLVGLADGQVGVLPSSVTADDFKAMVTRSGGEDVDPKSLFMQ